jgi:hypothetical protein
MEFDEGLIPALGKTPEEFPKEIRFSLRQMVRDGRGVAGEGC